MPDVAEGEAGRACAVGERVAPVVPCKPGKLLYSRNLRAPLLVCVFSCSSSALHIFSHALTLWIQHLTLPAYSPGQSPHPILEDLFELGQIISQPLVLLRPLRSVGDIGFSANEYPRVRVVGLLQLILDKHPGIVGRVFTEDVGRIRADRFFLRLHFEIKADRLAQKCDVLLTRKPGSEVGGFISPSGAHVDSFEFAESGEGGHISIAFALV